MAAKDKFNSTEWQLLRDGPDWVFAALAGADGNALITTQMRETDAFRSVQKKYSTSSVLVKEVIADKGKPARGLKGASLAEAEQSIQAINTLLATKLTAEEGNAYRQFLTAVGNAVAEATGEGLLGLGSKISKKEKAALDRIVKALAAPAPAKPASKPAAAPPKAAAPAKPAPKAAVPSKPAAKSLPAAKPAGRPAAASKPSPAVKTGPAAKSMTPATGARAKGSLVGSGKTAGSAMNKPMGSMRPAPSAAQAQAYMAEHTVVSGETLSHISLKYYNSAAKPKYMVIYEANKAVIGDNPNMIKPGMVLKIPKL